MQSSSSFTIRFARTFLKISAQHQHFVQQQQTRQYDLMQRLPEIRQLFAAKPTKASQCNRFSSFTNYTQKQQLQQPAQQRRQLFTNHNNNTMNACVLGANIAPSAAAMLLSSCSMQRSAVVGEQGTKALTLSRAYCKFTSACEDPNMGSVSLFETRATELITSLKDSEREAIKIALAKYDADMLRKSLEGKLAATQWRTRFGRLSKVPSLGNVDPTGTFCAFPDDWLKKIAGDKVKDPAASDLLKIFYVNCIPFIAFGFLDNFAMIIAGDGIEGMFSHFMTISTMAAAGLGNTLSDILGIGTAIYVERGCEKLGLRPPDLTPAQLNLKSSQRAANWGRIIGITVGCLLGMIPLLFLDKKPPPPPAATATCTKEAAQ